MNVSRLLRRLLSLLSFSIIEEGGGFTDAEPSPAAESSAPAPAPEASPAPAPASMLDAINAHFNEQTDPATGQPRDERGRFAPKPGEVVSPEAQQAVQQPQQATQQAKPQPTEPADELAMPEGLQPKAQERFKRLADTVRQQGEELEQAQKAISYVQQTFQENGIQREQFDQAVSFLGAVNKGDFATAEKMLLGQIKQLSLLTGKSYGLEAADPLSDYGDLRTAVDNMQITESHALEIARNRATQQAQQQRQAQQQQAQQTQQAQQQAVQQGTMAVDRLCKQLSASDMDYAAIEAQLLPVLPQLLQGMPPNLWENAVRTQYDLLKKSAATFRSQAAPPPTTVLRPTGNAAGAAAPKSMYEAMWSRG